MISCDELMPLILQRFPGFEGRWRKHLESAKGNDGGFCDSMVEFGHYITELIVAGNSDELKRFAATVEELIVSGDRDVRYAATIGLLEDLKGMQQSEEKWEYLVSFLQPKALEFCKELAAFRSTPLPGKIQTP